MNPSRKWKTIPNKHLAQIQQRIMKSASPRKWKNVNPRRRNWRQNRSREELRGSSKSYRSRRPENMLSIFQLNNVLIIWKRAWPTVDMIPDSKMREVPKRIEKSANFWKYKYLGISKRLRRGRKRPGWKLRKKRSGWRSRTKLKRSRRNKQQMYKLIQAKAHSWLMMRILWISTRPKRRSNLAKALRKGEILYFVDQSCRRRQIWLQKGTHWPVILSKKFKFKQLQKMLQRQKNKPRNLLLCWEVDSQML